MKYAHDSASVFSGALAGFVFDHSLAAPASAQLLFASVFH
jgi:hypothetical protein